MPSDNTCYPSFSFLPLQWNHLSRRNFFLDCGTLGSVYICEDGKALMQKVHDDQKCHLCAQFPSLPLFKKPKYGLTDVDLVGQQILKQRNNKFLYLGKRIKELKTLLKRKKFKSDAIMNLLKYVYEYENEDCSIEKVLDQFNQITELRKVYERYSDLFDMDVQKTNTSFTGGCLQIVNVPGEPSTTENDSMYMAAVSGLELNKIKIFRADLEKSGLLSVDESQMIEVESSQPVFELSNQCLYDQSLLAARSKGSCFIYNISTENPMLKCLDEVNLKNEDLTSIFMSPYISAECLIATDTGSVYLWNAEKGYNLVYGQPKGVSCSSMWSDVHYGSHPQSIVLTNHTSMDLLDLRTGKKATKLFSLPCRHLKNKERLHVSKFSTRNSFQHFLATDYALFLLDERFPRYPVLQWQHMLEGLPQYMSLVTGVVQSLQEDVLMVGSQYPSEVISIQYRTSETNPPTAVSSPWRISKPLDLFYINNMHHKIEDIFVKNRLMASCIGIVGQPLNPEGMLAFQLNSMGDIFFQKYNTKTKVHDKTCSAGPGDHVVQLTSEAKHRGSYWMDHLRENIQTDNVSDVEHQNIISFIKCLSEPPSSHVLCRLCMTQCDNEDIQSDDEDVIDGSCMTCNSTLQQSKWIVDGVEQDKVIRSEDISIEKQIPSIKNIPKSSSSLTRTLCKLWNDEELSEAESEEEKNDEEKEAENDKENEERQEVEEEEEEEEEVEMNMNELNSNKTFNFVHWSEEDSEEEEEAPTPKTNIPSTLPEPKTNINISSTLPEPETNINIPSTVPEPETHINIPSTVSEPETNINIHSTLPEPETNINIPSTLPEPETHINIPSTVPEPETNINICSTLPEPETNINIPSTLPEPKTHINIPSTVPEDSDDNPDSPLILGPTQEPVIPDSVPMFSEFSQRQPSPVASPSKLVENESNNTLSQTEQISFINANEQKKSNWLPDNSDDDDNFFNSSSSSKTLRMTQDSCWFLSPVIVSQREMNSPKTSLAKKSVYEDGFGNITDTQKMNSPSFLLSPSSASKKSWTKLKLKRKYEEGF